MRSNADVYRKLQKHIDNMPIAFPASESDLDIKLLKHLFTPSEAKIALELSALPEPLERIYRRVKKVGITIAELEKTLDRLVEKGSIAGGKYFERIGPQKLYSKAPLAIGMYELQIGRLTKEFEKDYQGYLNELYYKAFHQKGTSQMRTIPINKSVKIERYVESYDNVRDIIQNTKRPIAVMECICRKGKDLLEDPCRHSDIRETCILLEDTANYFIDIGIARVLTKKETSEILNKAEKAGFVLQPENNQNPNFICCCCSCCCNVLTTYKKFPKPADYYHSNYYSTIDPERCEVCWECTEIYPMEALTIEDSYPLVDLDRCIGCGVCASKCPADAIDLKKNNAKYIPPKDNDAMYKKILVERIGVGGMLKTLPKIILRQKI